MGHFFIMRHGEAEAHAASNAERQLTAYGAAYSKQIAQQLAGYIVNLEVESLVLLHSPYTRARQTAQELRQAIPIIKKVYCVDFVTPDADPGECFNKLGHYAEKPFILVSHMPLVAALSSLIVEGNKYSSQSFHTSEVRIFTAETWGIGCGQLEARIY